MKSEKYEKWEMSKKRRFRALCSQMEKFTFFYALTLFFKKIEISISEFENGQK